jgi:hypothetical protein
MESPSGPSGRTRGGTTGPYPARSPTGNFWIVPRYCGASGGTCSSRCFCIATASFSWACAFGAFTCRRKSFATVRCWSGVKRNIPSSERAGNCWLSLAFVGAGMAFLHHCALESGWALPHHRSHDDPGERSQDDIDGKDKRQEQRPHQIAHTLRLARVYPARQTARCSCGLRSPSGRPISRYGGTYFEPILAFHLCRGQKPGTSDEWHRCDPDAHY